MVHSVALIFMVAIIIIISPTSPKPTIADFQDHDNLTHILSIPQVVPNVPMNDISAFTQ